MLIETLSTPLQVVRPGGNATAATITEPVPTRTAPAGDGVIPVGFGGSVASQKLKIVPYGVGADTNTFLMYAYGWSATVGTNGVLWVPATLATFTGCTLDSNLPGVDATDVPSTNYFCSAITLGVGNSPTSVEVVSPGHTAHEMAHVVLDCKGFAFVELRFATGSSATSMNALYGKL
jgi:hypothetical protein